MTAERWNEIQESLKGIAPFNLYYDRPQAATEHAGVSYPITPQEPIDELKQALHKAAVFDGAVYRRRQIPAHMTIAEFISIEDSLKLRDEIQDSAPSGEL